MLTVRTELIEINAAANKLKGLGGWRSLYLEFLGAMRPESLIEIGSGDPAFLKAASRSVGVVAGLDANAGLEDLYRREGVEFCLCDLDHGPLPVMPRKYASAICSDVFEHLLYPTRALHFIQSLLRKDGVLFSHVPNEFSVRKTIGIMAGRRHAVYFHATDEWDNPHLRRFTDKGFVRFLGQYFRYHVSLTDLRYGSWARVLASLRCGVPYCLQGGPTYASTNDTDVFEALRSTKLSLRDSLGKIR